MPYTIAEVDDALRAIAGERAVRPLESGWSRPHTLITAAARAWIDQRPEDDHSRVAREALLDLNRGGKFRPSDGVWPD